MTKKSYSVRYILPHQSTFYYLENSPIAQLLKAWKDYKKIDIKGMAITILVCNNFSVIEKRDDLSLLDTVTNIIDSLEDSFHCYKPVTPMRTVYGWTDERTQNIRMVMERSR